MERPRHVGKYEVISQVASGGFGVVYKGWDPYIKRPVAIKMCLTPDEDVRRRFQQEAQLVGNLVHRNITLVFDYGVEDGVPFIVQEFLTGFDLDQLAAAGTLSETRSVIAILLQVCEGLEFAHHRGIVHRDIKPANIRVLEDGTVKILDFGIAKSQQSVSRLTRTGIALGTAGYLAPEQIDGGPVDPRTDIFALGVVAYELVTRVRPFHSGSLSNVLYKILHEDPPPPSAVNPACSPELDRLITRSIAKDPGQRFQSAAELLDALRAIAVAEINDPDAGRDTTTGILRSAVHRMDDVPKPEAADEPTTAGLARPARAARPAHAQIEHPPSLDDTDRARHRPALVTFLVLLGVLGLAAALLYYSKDVQRLVFRGDGPPWMPTPTPTSTTTPTPTATPAPTATPTPGLVTVQLVVDPPAALRVDGQPFGSGRVTGGATQLMPGSHTFTLTLPGFPERTLVREVSPDTSTLSLTLEVGMLTVMLDPTRSPPGGVAFLDGRELGPMPLVRRKVPAGEHVLTVRWPGIAAPYQRVISVPLLPNELRLPPVAPPPG
ncbi:MAG TPA: serine/threonine-protein kinase [Thermoanaerobaculales bacterium]|nr:serine/threonine-protein kinase [Thermoanaerobaculales bacterium]HPA79305.1 serine/threonine-protein kinase [Thermoanaerobaculales bacterium]HQL31423.1 serine/threonine-protein kinase [Thermoanaerobaculales bacterium]HQN96144.1 serine/threonine-protein kinase [Thermoanaerobaculales bacterium]HQP42654.1 serine/threonine-protein kinase [Thermoanaerobaculales bacterium]